MTILRYEPWALVEPPAAAARSCPQPELTADSPRPSAGSRTSTSTRRRALRGGRRSAGRRRQGHRDHRREGRADDHGRARLGEEDLERRLRAHRARAVARSCAASRCPRAPTPRPSRRRHVNGVLESAFRSARRNSRGAFPSRLPEAQVPRGSADAPTVPPAAPRAAGPSSVASRAYVAAARACGLEFLGHETRTSCPRA